MTGLIKTFFEIGGVEDEPYRQLIESNTDGNIIDASCSCKWGTINYDAYISGKTICKHLKQALELMKKGVKNGYTN